MGFAKYSLLVFIALVLGFVPGHAARYSASTVSIDGITADVRVVTTGGDQVELTLRQGRVYRPIRVVLEDGVLALTGETPAFRKADECCQQRIHRTENLTMDRNYRPELSEDEAFFSNYPVIELSVPRRTHLTFSNATLKLTQEDLEGNLTLDACYVYGEAGSLGHAIINVVSGSRLVLGDVKSSLELDISGDAAVVTGDVAMADIDMAGAGDLSIGSITGMTDISVAGSGDIRIARVEGPMTVRIAGSGVVSVQSGRADELRAFIDGSGGLFFQGAAASPDLRLSGSAEVWLTEVSGTIRRHGQGSVYVKGALLPKR